MDERAVDVVIIGAGTAGLNARREVVKAGRTYALVEEGPYGTTCARVGCMPSKLLIAAAEAAWESRHAGRFGVHTDVRVDGREVMDRVRSERDRFVGFVVQATEALPEEVRVRGHARLVGPTTVEVGGHTRLLAGSVVLATGSRPWIPSELEGVGALVNDDVFDWEDLPGSVAVFGTGIIGLELGQALSRLGVRVVMFNPFDMVGPFSDPALQREAREVLGRELDLQLGVEIRSVERDDEGVVVRWVRSSGSEAEARFEHVLAAAGRRSNVDRLGLEDLGLELDRRGVPARDERTCQLGDSPIFLAGDAAAHRPLLHEAADEGRIAGANAARFPEVTAGARRTPLAVAFCEPQIGMVGARYADLDLSSVEIGEVSWADQGRARVMGRNAGMGRIYADRACGELLGAELLGPRVEHMAHLLAWAVQQRMTVNQALSMPFYHPVVEEGLRTALRDVGSKLRTVGRCPPKDRADGPGE